MSVKVSEKAEITGPSLELSEKSMYVIPKLSESGGQVDGMQHKLSGSVRLELGRVKFAFRLWRGRGPRVGAAR